MLKVDLNEEFIENRRILDKSEYVEFVAIALTDKMHLSLSESVK
jgi:hypothetical protein